MSTRLSEHRERAGEPDEDWMPHPGWDPAWARPALRDSEGTVLWLGAEDRDSAWIPLAMQRYPTWSEHLASGEPLQGIRASIDEARLADWWPRAHAAWRRIVGDGVPVLWMPSPGWQAWSGFDPTSEPHGRDPEARPSHDWHGLLELQRRTGRWGSSA